MRNAEDDHHHGNSDGTPDPCRADGEHLEAMEANELAVLIRFDEQEHDGKNANDVADACRYIVGDTAAGLSRSCCSSAAGRLTCCLPTGWTRGRVVRHL